MYIYCICTNTGVDSVSEMRGDGERSKKEYNLKLGKYGLLYSMIWAGNPEESNDFNFLNPILALCQTLRVYHEAVTK